MEPKTKVGHCTLDKTTGKSEAGEVEATRGAVFARDGGDVIVLATDRPVDVEFEIVRVVGTASTSWKSYESSYL